jgi:hypothetical protein
MFEKIVKVAGYLSNGAERLGIRDRLDSTPIAFAGAFDHWPGFSRSAICLFTRSISTTSFFDS